MISGRLPESYWIMLKVAHESLTIYERDKECLFMFHAKDIFI